MAEAIDIWPALSGLLIHPDHVPAPEEPKPVTDEPPVRTDGSDGPTTPPVGSPEPGSSKPTQFYAQFNLDPVRCIKQLGEIADHVSSKLGDDVELALEIRAKSEEGLDESTRRTVSENARSLGAQSSEFA